jgi:hypothetical protein
MPIVLEVSMNELFEIRSDNQQVSMRETFTHKRGLL